MATEGVRIELKGSEQAIGRLRDVWAKTDDKQGLFDAIGASLVVSTQHRFERETGPDGKTWPASLRAETFGGKTLTDSARLVGSITHNATADGVEVGTNVIYAAIHQLGGIIRALGDGYLRFKGASGWASKKSVTMPARPFLGLDDDDNKEIVALADDWLAKPLGGADVGP
jgi:phage virion morphogenesis protein